MTKRRTYGTGSVYFVRKKGYWVGAFYHGYTETGAPRRLTVTAKTEAEAKRRLRDKRLAIEAGQNARADTRKTVAAWADEWLALTEHDLAPKTWTTNRGQVRRWVVPTIGHVRLAELTHDDVRKVAAAQRKAGQARASITRCKAVLLKMMKDATAEGHPVPLAVVAVQPRQKRRGPRPDRRALTIPEALACIDVAREHLPHFSRWGLAFLQGLRQGEALGLTWDCVDLDGMLPDPVTGELIAAPTLTVAWKLERLPYLDKHDRSRGFRVPDDHEARQLFKSVHLTRPKTAAGERVIPLVPWAAETLRAWRDVAPANPHGLVWTRLDGRPIDKDDDLEEWKAIQGAAEVGHPNGRYYLGHEIRNTTATLLAEAGVDPFVITAILGHTDIETSRAYVTRRAQQARPAMEGVAGALGLGPGLPTHG